jgi:hypothetical protein
MINTKGRMVVICGWYRNGGIGEQELGAHANYW